MTFAVLCPGQGAQHSAMLDLALASPEGRRVVDASADALGEDPRRWAADPSRLFDNVVAQPLICVAQLAQWHALRHLLPRPAALAGYSVGELACYGVADALDAPALARLARERAQAMDSATTRAGTLAGVRGLARATVARICKAHGAYVAIAVDDDVFVVGGLTGAVDEVVADAQRAGAQVTRLDVGVPSHTPLLGAARGAFRAALERSPLRAPAATVIAGIDAAPVTTRERAIDTLSRQVAETIEWSRCVDALYERGCRVFLELGPGRALAKTVQSRHDDVAARAIEDFRSADAVVRWVARQLG